MKKKLSCLAFGTIVGGLLLTSCSNDLNTGGGNVNLDNLNPVVAPDLITYSGDQTFYNSFNGTINTATRSDDGIVITDLENNGDWIKENKPSEISEAEREYVKNWFSNNPGLSENGFDITNFYLQLVYGKSQNIEGRWHRYDQNKPEGEKYWDEPFTADNVSIDYLECGWDNSSPFLHISNFNSNGGGGTPTVYIKNGSALKWEFKVSWDSSIRNYFKAAIIDVPGIGIGYYIGLSIYGEKSNNGTQYIGEERLQYAEDWIIKVIPGEGVIAPEPCPNGCGHEKGNCPDDCDCGCKGSTGGNTGCNCEKEGCDCGDDCQCTPDNCTCENCGSDGNGQGNNGNTGDNNGDNTGNNSGNNGNNNGVNNKYTNRELEVNLSLNDIHTLPDGQKKYDIADLVSKLSIHVRYPGDVEVIIPVPEKFYCDQDDLYILKDHYESNGTPNWVYGGGTLSYPNVIEGVTVTLTVEFVPESRDELTVAGKGYIKVTTEGITEQLITTLHEKYGDGINFEVYNYFNRGNMYTTGNYAEIDYFDLQYNYLSRSVVNFPDNTLPDFYINAFNEIDGAPVAGDCYVWITGDERVGATYKGLTDWRSKFFDAYQGVHLNGSHFNWIYTNQSVKGSVNPTENVMPDLPWPFVKAPYQSFRYNDNDNYTFE